MQESLLRQRPQPAKTILDTLKSYDIYAKPIDDFRIKTATGASLTLISSLLVLILAVSEFADWVHIDIIPTLNVDTSRKDKMNINLDVVFPKMPCFLVNLDIMDVAGEHHNDLKHDVHKTRLDQAGREVMGKLKIGMLYTCRLLFESIRLHYYTVTS